MAVTRSNTKRRTRKRKRLNSKRRMTLKSKALKKVIGNVIDHKKMCAEPIGHYTKSYGMEINPSITSDSYERVAVGGSRLLGNTAPYTAFACAFLPLNYKKILDAASVMFTAKPAAFNFEDTTTTLDAKVLKLDVAYCSYALTLTNFTQRTYTIDLYEITNKVSSQTNYIDTATSVAASQKWKGPADIILTTPTIAKTNNLYEVPMNLEFSMYEGLEHKYSSYKHTKVVRPGEKLNYFVSMGQQCIDFQKHNEIGGANLASYAKGQTQVFFRFTPHPIVAYNLTEAATTHIANNTSNYVFSVDVKEVYKILQPATVEEANEGDIRALFVDYGKPIAPLPTGYLSLLPDGQQYQEVTNPKQ